MANNVRKPEPIALIVCDQVITDQKTNKKSLIGVFNNISAANFPCHHPALSIFVSVTDGPDRTRAAIRIVKEDNQHDPLEESVVFESSGEIQFPNPLVVVELIFEIVNLQFAEPGRYRIEFRCDDEIVLQRPFQVTQIQERNL